MAGLIGAIDVLSQGSGTDPESQAFRGQLIGAREHVFGIANKFRDRAGLAPVPFELRGKEPNLLGAVGKNIASVFAGSGAQVPQVLSGQQRRGFEGAVRNIPDTMLPDDIVDFFMDAGATEEQALSAMESLPAEIKVAMQYSNPDSFALSIQRDILGTPGEDRQALMRDLNLQEPLPEEPWVGSPGTQFLDPATRDVFHTVPFQPPDPKVVSLFDRKLGVNRSFHSDTAFAMLNSQENLDDGTARWGPEITESKSEVTSIAAPTKALVEKDFLSLDDLDARLTWLIPTMDPNLMTYAGRTKNWIMEHVDRTSPLAPGPARDEFTRRAVVFAESWGVINRGIKYLTGAQMSQREAVRLSRQFPTPPGGADIPGDSPSQWHAKATNLHFWTKLTKARNAFVIREGKIPGVDDPTSDNWRQFDNQDMGGRTLTEMVNILSNEYNTHWDQEIDNTRNTLGVDDVTPQQAEMARAKAAVAVQERFGVDPTLILDEVARPTSLVRDGLDVHQLAPELQGQ